MTLWQAAAVAVLVWELTHRLALCRRLLRELSVAIVAVDLAAVRLVRWLVPPRYELQGACQRRGACCTQIVAHLPRRLRKRPRLVAAFIAMHRWVHNFHLVGEGPDGQLVFRCHYLRHDGRCGIYRLRPRLCRTYPLLPFFAPPQLLPGCGYRVRRRGLHGSARLRLAPGERSSGTHHPTPPTRPGDTALEHAEDFVPTHFGATKTGQSDH